MEREQPDNPNAEDGNPQKASMAQRTWESVRCSHCGKGQVASLQTFAVGTGSAYRTLIDDVYCMRCGVIGQPMYDLSDAELNNTDSGIGRRSLKRVETGC